MYKKLVKGLAIYRQSHTNSIYVRLRVAGKEIRRSLKTSDLDDAITKAWALKFEMDGMVKAGLEIVPVKKHSITNACKAVITLLENKKPQKPIYKDYIYIYNNFIIPHFKNKPIDNLTTKNIRLYFESLDLSKTRFNSNKTCFTTLLNHLEEEELLAKKDFPTLPKGIKTKQNKIGFDFKSNDIDIIKDFIKSSEWIDQEKINFKTKEYREIFPHIFDFLLSTGLRPGEEMNNIRVSDIQLDKGTYYCKIRKGKTKEHRQRDIILNNKAISAIRNILQITRKSEITERQLLHIKDGFVFESSFRKIGDWCKLFHQIITRLIEERKITLKYTLYCCRHTYITQLLLKDVQPFLISKQVGNAVDMIEKHYDHSLLKDSKNIDMIMNYDKTRIFEF